MRNGRCASREGIITAVVMQDRKKEADIDRKKREEIVRRWLEAKELYEKYPRIAKALAEGKYLKEYQKTIERIAEESRGRKNRGRRK